MPFDTKKGVVERRAVPGDTENNIRTTWARRSTRSAGGRADVGAAAKPGKLWAEHVGHRCRRRLRAPSTRMAQMGRL